MQFECRSDLFALAHLRAVFHGAGLGVFTRPMVQPLRMITRVPRTVLALSLIHI